VNDTVLAVLLAAGLAGALSTLVPTLVRAVPEPATDEWADDPDAEPKKPYAAIADGAGLRWRSVLAGVGVGALLGWGVGLDWPLLWLVPLVPVCLALAVIDWHTRLLPKVLVIPASVAALIVVTVVALATGEQDALVRSALALVAVRSFFWVLWFIRSAGMGFGDVRLAALVGLVLGWVGWGAVLIGVWVGFFAFALPGLALAIVRRDRSLLRKPFPYGPFMLVGALAGVVRGGEWAQALWG
jgi:leader peptidase (prepilin peptidase)/N-methyltransferase